jgi:hypothetical protein
MVEEMTTNVMESGQTDDRISAILAEVKDAPPPPRNANTVTAKLRSHDDEILALKAAGWTWPDIAALFNKNGIKVSVGLLRASMKGKSTKAGRAPARSGGRGAAGRAAAKPAATAAQPPTPDRQPENIQPEVPPAVPPQSTETQTGTQTGKLAATKRRA